jgi:hypothetical protein
MPRKRPIDVRIAETEDKMVGLKLEKAIADMRLRMRKTKPRRRK